MRRLMTLAALAGSAACAPTYDVKVDANGPIPVVSAPEHAAGAGQTVRVLVTDTVWGNRWTATVADTALPAISRSLVFMEGQLSALTRWFEPARRRTSTNADGVPFHGMVDRANQVVTCASAAKAFTEVNNAADAAAERANDVVAELGGTEYSAALAFASDTVLHQFADRLATAPAARNVESRLLQAASTGAVLSPKELDQVLMSSLAHVARVRALQAGAPPSAPAEGRSLTDALQDVREAWEAYDRLVQAREALAARFTGCVSRTWADIPLERMAGGVDVQDLLRPERVASLERVYATLGKIERDVRKLAGALNQLPYWTRHRGTDTVFARAFEGNHAITFQLAREPRYGTFLVAEEEKERENNDADGAAAAAPSTAAAGAAKPRVEAASASHRVEVFPRYRFHLGAGLVRSSLRTREYATTPDTVDGVTGVRLSQTSETPSQVFPAAFLSYNLLPLGGRSYDAREYRGWLRSLGLSLQAGVSLRDPTESVFLGATTELFPGIHLGFGHHLAYTQATSFAPGEFVPDARGAPVEKRWRGEWSAWSVGVDANVFFSTLGSLFK